MKMQLFFYQNDKLITVSEKGRPRTIFRADDRPLAEQHVGDAGTPGLLATDDKGSVLTVKSNDEEEDHAYSAYGHDSTMHLRAMLCGFNGELAEPLSGYYLLGTGHHRPYATTLRRFIASDSWSPLGSGGFNSYGYCGGDPINRNDPSGHDWLTSFLKGVGNLLHLRKRRPEQPASSIIRPQSTANHTPRSPQQTALPAYSQEVPKTHSVVEKAADIHLNEAKALETKSELYNRVAEWQRLQNLGKELKGGKVKQKKIDLERALFDLARDTAKQAHEIRNTPGISAPPKYRK